MNSYGSLLVPAGPRQNRLSVHYFRVRAARRRRRRRRETVGRVAGWKGEREPQRRGGLSDGGRGDSRSVSRAIGVGDVLASGRECSRGASSSDERKGAINTVGPAFETRGCAHRALPPSLSLSLSLSRPLALFLFRASTHHHPGPLPSRAAAGVALVGAVLRLSVAPRARFAAE